MSKTGLIGPVYFIKKMLNYAEIYSFLIIFIVKIPVAIETKNRINTLNQKMPFNEPSVKILTTKDNAL